MISTWVMNRNVHAGVCIRTIIVNNSLYDTRLPLQVSNTTNTA